MYGRYIRKQKLHGEDTCPSHHHCRTLAGDAGPVTGGGGLRVCRIRVSWVSFMYVVVMCMLVIVAPPTVMPHSG